MSGKTAIIHLCRLFNSEKTTLVYCYVYADSEISNITTFRTNTQDAILWCSGMLKNYKTAGYNVNFSFRAVPENVNFDFFSNGIPD